MFNLRSFKLRTSFLALFGFVALAFQPASDANASTLFAGGSYQFEDHSNDNHSGEILDGIDLSFGSFASSNLRNASFIAAVFEQTDFSDANLLNVDLMGADLTDAVFNSGTILKNADLSGAVLVGIDLTGVNVQNAIFIGALYDSTTILPFDPVGAGMVVIPELSPMTLMGFGLLILATLKYEKRRGPGFVPSTA